MTRVAVSDAVLRWALQRSGRPSAIEHKFPKLGEWLKGESRPTLRQFEHMPNVTPTALGCFFRAEPPEERLPIPHFCTLGGEPTPRRSPDLLEVVQSFPPPLRRTFDPVGTLFTVNGRRRVSTGLVDGRLKTEVTSAECRGIIP